MHQSTLWTDRLLSDRSNTLFQALHAQELGAADYVSLLNEVVEPEVAFFLRNTYGSLALAEAGD
jgi:hypothetical protein